MSYALFLGFSKIGIYSNFEEAKAAINRKGIWNICQLWPPLINNKTVTAINKFKNT